MISLRMQNILIALQIPDKNLILKSLWCCENLFIEYHSYIFTACERLNVLETLVSLIYWLIH